MLEERSTCSLTSGQLGFQCSLSLHGSCIDSSQVCSASPGSTGCSLVFFLTYEKEGKKETVRVYFAFTSECLACGDEPVVSDRTLSVVSVLHFYFPTLPSSSHKAKRWYGGELYNSAVDSLPPVEVEQDLACLLPRKPKVLCLCTQVLNKDK